jgi:hypothetical protein
MVSAKCGDAIVQGDHFEHRGLPPTQCFDIGPTTGGKLTTKSTKRHSFILQLAVHGVEYRARDRTLDPLLDRGGYIDIPNSCNRVLRHIRVASK